MSFRSLWESEVPVSVEEPFKGDLLDRRELVESVAGALASFRGSHVVAINGGYGSGKMTVLRFLEARLIQRGFRVPLLNAWEHDHRHPLESLLSAAGRAAGDRAWRASLKKAAEAVLPDLVGELAPPGARGLSEQVLRRLFRDSQPLDDFRRQLEAAVEGVDSKGVVFLIDELDRCRPDRAIGILEWSKHAFSIDGVHFVLGVHLDQLGHTVRKLYGAEFDGIGYLERLIHMTVNLPPTTVDAVVDQELKTRATRELLSSRDSRRDSADATHLFKSLLAGAKIEARAAIRGTALFDTVLRMLPEERKHVVFGNLLAAMVFLKTALPQEYRRFIAGQASDLDISRELEEKGLRRADGTHALFLAYLIHAQREIASDLRSERFPLEESLLFQDCHSKKQEDESSRNVLDLVDRLTRMAHRYVMRDDSLGTLLVLRRIEWLAPF